MIESKIKISTNDVKIFSRAQRDIMNCEFFFEKLNWLRSYQAMFFEFPAILLLFLETYVLFKMVHLLKQLSFSKAFS